MVIVFCEGGFVTVSADVWVQFVPVGYYMHGVVVQGLEVLESVRSNQPLIEYKGKVMLREQYDKENIFFKRYVFPELSLYPFTSALVF